MLQTYQNETSASRVMKAQRVNVQCYQAVLSSNIVNLKGSEGLSFGIKINWKSYYFGIGLWKYTFAQMHSKIVVNELK